MSRVSPNPSLMTSAARASLPSISALVTSVVAWTTGARTSPGSIPARWRALSMPRLTPSSGRSGVLSVLSTTTRPVSPSSSTTSVNVPPMSTATRQSAIPVFLPHRAEDVHDPDLAALGVADEMAVAVGQAAGRVVHVAGLQQDPLLGADAEVELAGDDQSELLVVGMPVVGRGTVPVVDPPERQAQVVPVEDPPAHPRPCLAERGIVERPDMRVRRHLSTSPLSPGVSVVSRPTVLVRQTDGNLVVGVGRRHQVRPLVCATTRREERGYRMRLPGAGGARHGGRG